MNHSVNLSLAEPQRGTYQERVKTQHNKMITLRRRWFGAGANGDTTPQEGTPLARKGQNDPRDACM